MYIKDLQTGEVRKYGSDRHDSLVISEDGKTLSYENLHNGEGSLYGEYRFCDEEGKIPAETECNYGEEYFNIGGWGEPKTGHWIEHPHEAGENWEYSMYECSECCVWADDNSDYCSNCGAKMDGEEGI